MSKKKNRKAKSNDHTKSNGIASRNKSLLGHNAIFTPEVMDGDKPRLDLLNKYSHRSTAYKAVNMSLSKDFRRKDYSVSLGINIYNLFNSQNENYVYPLTGNSYDPGDYYTDEVGYEEGRTLSNAYYDRPWYYSSPREINLFIRIDFRW